MAEYKLIYWPGLPGRGEFVRLYFEATATPYVDVSNEQGGKADVIFPYLKGEAEASKNNPVPFAVPVLQHGDVIISQTPAIILYLSARLPPVELAAADEEPDAKKTKHTGDSLFDASTAYKASLLLTILDLNNEVHDTHHPIDVGEYYEKQKDAALARSKPFRESRLPKYFSYFERNVQDENGFLTKDGPSYADLALFQVVHGLRFAFPNWMKKHEKDYPKVVKLAKTVEESARISAYLKSKRRQEYNMGVFRHYPELDEQD